MKRPATTVRLLKSCLRAVPIAVVGALFLALSPVLLPWLLVRGWRGSLRRRRFLRDNAGRTYFIWGARHNWKDFVCNNVLPALPPTVEPLFHRSPLALRLRGLIRWSPNTGARPWLIIVGRKTVHVRSLNPVLRERKRMRHDPATQAAVRSALHTAIEDLAAQVRQTDPPTK